MNIEKKFLNVDDLATCLNVSPATIYWWVETGRLPHNKFGKLVRFNQDDVTAWIKDKSRSIVADKN